MVGKLNLGSLSYLQCPEAFLYIPRLAFTYRSLLTTVLRPTIHTGGHTQGEVRQGNKVFVEASTRLRREVGD